MHSLNCDIKKMFCSDSSKNYSLMILKSTKSCYPQWNRMAYYHKWIPSCFSYVWLFATMFTVACQAPVSMGFSQQASWSGLPCPSPGSFLTQGSNPGLLHCRWILDRLSHQGRQVTKIKSSKQSEKKDMLCREQS